MDAAEDLELIEFFNWLVYIKEKDKHDEQIIKNSRKVR